MTIPGLAVCIVTATSLVSRSISTLDMPASSYMVSILRRIFTSSLTRAAYSGPLPANQVACQSFVIPTRKPLGCIFCPNLNLLFVYNNSNMTTSSVYSPYTPTSSRTKPLNPRSFISKNFSYSQVFHPCHQFIFGI